MVTVRKSATRRVLGVLGLVCAAAAWFFLAPQSVGGSVAYAVVTGQSMEPGLEAGDLVIVREHPAYGVGDAVAYRSANLDQIVLHRIVSQEDGSFVMKGDNNDFLDGDKPSEADVLGKQWVHLPRVGLAFSFLRSTVGMAIGGVAVLGLLGFFSIKERRRRTNGKHRREPAGQTTEEIRTPAPATPTEPQAAPATLMRRRLQVGAAVAAGCVVLSAGVTFAAFKRPMFEGRPVRVGLVHTGEFAYSAPAPNGPVYQAPRLEAGDPVFVRLIRELQTSFDYELVTDGDLEGDVSGTMRLALRTDNGWAHYVDLASGTAAAADPLRLEGRLGLNAIRDTLRRVENQTGMAPGTYSVALEPSVTIDGTLEGKRVRETFAPALPFQLNDIQLGLVRPQEGGLEASLHQILNPTQKSTITVTRLVPHPFTLWGRQIPVLAVRRVGSVAAVLSLVALLVLCLLWMKRRPKDEAARIEARYSSLLIPVQDAPGLRQETIAVTDFDTLVRLAQQFEQPVMHQTQPGAGHVYLLYYDGLTYCYRIEGENADDVPVLRFEPKPPAERPLVKAVLTRPVRPESIPAAEEASELRR